MHRWLLLLAILMPLCAPPALAQERPWSDEAELSLVDTGGNTEVRSIALKNLLSYRFTPQLSGAWKFEALNGRSDGARNAESYTTSVRLDYLFNEHSYVFGDLGWHKDTFSGIDSQLYAGGGYGYRFLTGPVHTLAGEVGLNYVTEEYTDDTDRDYLRGRAFAKYGYAFSEKSRFSQSLEYLYDFDEATNYNLISETALISALNSSLSFKGSYLIKYDNQPVPATLDRTDTILSLALVANF